MVARDDDAAAIENLMLAQELFIDAQHVGRCGCVAFHVIIELKAVHVAEITRLVHAQDDGLEKPIEASEHLLGRYWAR